MVKLSRGSLKTPDVCLILAVAVDLRRLFLLLVFCFCARMRAGTFNSSEKGKHMNSAQTAVTPVGDGKRSYVSQEDAIRLVREALIVRHVVPIHTHCEEMRFNIDRMLAVVYVNGSYPGVAAHLEFFHGVSLASDNEVAKLDGLRAELRKGEGLPSHWCEQENTRVRLAAMYSHVKTKAFASCEHHRADWHQRLADRIIDLASIYRVNHPSFAR